MCSEQPYNYMFIYVAITSCILLRLLMSTMLSAFISDAVDIADRINMQDIQRDIMNELKYCVVTKIFQVSSVLSHFGKIVIKSHVWVQM